MLLVFSGTSWGFAPYGRYVDFSTRLGRRCSNDCMLDLDLAMPLPLATPLPADGIDRTFPCHNEYKAKGTRERPCVGLHCCHRDGRRQFAVITFFEDHDKGRNRSRR